ncbi:lipopolysaccharide biosynthesis protein [Microbacterium sp. LWO12-1.2]|uniref:lipopolysaccharide biosynthesis protein n=1 Tax=Microbacterium sp. LWO12-1.2 TaxID=3135261 RepID=UPI003412333F
MNSLLALGARALTMVISLVCGVITTRMILGETDIQHYALYSLLITIPSLLTFTDLGSGAVLVNAVATSDDIRTDRKLRLQITSVGRVLLMFATGLMVINTVLLVTGGWRALFGDAGAIPGAALAAFLCITLFSLSITLGVWFRILLGQRRNHLVILVQGMISPVTLGGVWLMLTFGGRSFDSYLAIASYGASLFSAIVGFLLVARSTAPLIPDSMKMVLRWRSVRGVRVMDVGWPMLAQMVTYPIAVGSQRYVLAQFGTPVDVAEYGVAGQVFFALNGLVMAAGVALWPQFARLRHKGELRRGPYLLSMIFAGAIAAATFMVWFVAPWLFEFITQGELEVRTLTILAFGCMIMLTAAVYPLGMFIMDKPGIRFQVIPTLAMAAVSIILSVVLTPLIGIVGPLIGVSFALIVCQIIPYSIYIHRHRERLLGAQGEPKTDEPAEVG